MNWTVSVTATLAAVASFAACAPPPGPAGGSSPAVTPTPAARQEVLARLDAQAAAWSMGDLEAFTAVYADDALFVTPSGVTCGRDAVLERYRKRYPTPEAMGTLSFEILEARAAPAADGAGNGGAVTVAARWALARPGRDDAAGYTLIVFHRIGERWLVVQDASM
jgi:uncharacterized protein (TIGR02246 family)